MADEYIKRGALLADYDKEHEGEPGRARKLIEDIPAADVVPVVRCKDCKYAYDGVGGWCCSHGICVDCIVREDFFCADGEKMDGEE